MTNKIKQAAAAKPSTNLHKEYFLSVHSNEEHGSGSLLNTYAVFGMKFAELSFKSKESPSTGIGEAITS